ncbi:Glycerate kinase [Bhargavaea cecembensis DSE10]|uniref:Glycerate kinase n=1 Tax=Bhargavaea cecembensis DSE10 TaxID=1235279 RepID=M7NH50_9BACL|nr:glycerate kinase [Bhargavaea cecembensis]EMR06521.1 Glycerate kinase [Bhargavaea cecembensis DSE10]
MNILIAIDSFKGSLTSAEAGEAAAAGIRAANPDAEIEVVPLADGGEGTVEALVQATGGELVRARVTGPLGEPVNAAYGILGDGTTAVIEIAEACGLPLIPEADRNPLEATSYGVGELILDAASRGARSLIVGLGGSATNDAGVGMLQALGCRFLDGAGEEVPRGGAALGAIRSADVSGLHPDIQSLDIQVACDVNNPLHGEQGAAYIYGPQKGATPEMVEELDSGLRNFAEVVEKELGKDIQEIPGAGAAGGLGAAFAGLLDAELRSGIELVLDTIGLEEKVRPADFVITGEGRMDAQSSMGKAAMGVAGLAEKHGVPVIALAGSATNEAASLNGKGMTAYFSILQEPITLEEAIRPEIARQNMETAAEQVFRLIGAVKPALPEVQRLK